MAMPKHDSIADYDAACTDEARAALAQVRGVIADLVPEGVPREERLSYGLPTLFVRGKRVVHYAGWAEHLAMYPIPESPPGDPSLREDLAPFVKGKGTLHFPYAAGLPTTVISRVVAAHLARVGIPASDPPASDPPAVRGVPRPDAVSSSTSNQRTAKGATQS